VKIEQFDDGFAVCENSTTVEAIDIVKTLLGDDFKFPLILTDPPYGNILDVNWDRTKDTTQQFVDWMVSWINLWRGLLCKRGSFYIWAGVGRPGFRPMYTFVPQVEKAKEFELANHITWSKRRAYGTKNNYLFTREELLWFVNGDAKHPRTFNVPYLDTKRGYAGYNIKYPALSEFYRRTNVWTDINELFRGKVHIAQKPLRVNEIPIEVHTDPGEYVLDLFAGSGSTALAARKLGRKFVVFENDEVAFDLMVKHLSAKQEKKEEK